MKRDFLQALTVEGKPLPKDVIDQIMAENGKDVQEAKKPPEDYEELKKQAAELKDLKAKDFEGQITKLNEEIAGGKDKVTALTTRAEKAERELLTQRIAHEEKLPYELAGRLTGNTEDELRADAKALGKFIGTQGGEPMRSTEPGKGSSTDAALQELNASLNFN